MALQHTDKTTTVIPEEQSVTEFSHLLVDSSLGLCEFLPAEPTDFF
jgi:hypothetical protein